MRNTQRLKEKALAAAQLSYSKAIELSKQRIASVGATMLECFKGIEPGHLETICRGWEEPAGTDKNLNRRVEGQWFTIE